MTAGVLYWTLVGLVSARMLWGFESQARTLGSYRMLLASIDMAGQANGADPAFSAVTTERGARRVLYVLGVLAGLAWPATLAAWIRGVGNGG